ncbi:MAG TPA: NAD(P)H-dependent oxidoreductase [Terracidiphilus sp.]|nr:NAD(P)H-dependent oxidoreductase [Terracidiphilus sp.]
MNDKIKVALIYGSARKGRFCDTVARWVAEQIARHEGFALEVIDPAVDSVQAPPEDDSLRGAPSLWERVAQADAFVVVTPEYNHGYPAPLKSLIDSVGAEWHAKPVAFVSYGGVSGGLRAVEQLRLVFAELHTVTIRDAVSFAGAWEQFDESGALLHPERHQRAMAAMLARLRWWATALRAARNAEPYGRAA